MRTTARPLIAMIGLAFLAAAPVAPAKPDPVEQKVTLIRGRSIAAVRACGVTPKVEPSVQILSEPAIIAYCGKSGTLVIGRWETLPPPIKGFLGQWAMHDMPGRSGEERTGVVGSPADRASLPRLTV